MIIMKIKKYNSEVNLGFGFLYAFVIALGKICCHLRVYPSMPLRGSKTE